MVTQKKLCEGTGVVIEMFSEKTHLLGNEARCAEPGLFTKVPNLRRLENSD